MVPPMHLRPFSQFGTLVLCQQLTIEPLTKIGDYDLTHHKRILVLEDEKLAAASILSLLISPSGLDVINTTVSSLAYLEQTDGLQPDVVILEEELLAANISAVVKLADRHPKLRLIVFNLSNNTLNIFDKQRLQVKQVNDFLELL